MYCFPLLGTVPTEQSLFTMTSTDHDPTFRPVFSDDYSSLFGNNTELMNQAIASCGGMENKQCLFDASQTGDTQTAAQSQQELNTFEEEKKQLGVYQLIV